MGFKINKKPEPTSAEVVNFIKGEAAAEQPVQAPAVQVEPQPAATPISEARTQIALRLTQSTKQRVLRLAASMTTDSMGTRRFSAQDVMETAILEYLKKFDV